MEEIEPTYQYSTEEAAKIAIEQMIDCDLLQRDIYEIKVSPDQINNLGRVMSYENSANSNEVVAFLRAIAVRPEYFKKTGLDIRHVLCGLAVRTAAVYRAELELQENGFGRLAPAEQERYSKSLPVLENLAKNLTTKPTPAAGPESR
jgi:hypothetical protein